MPISELRVHPKNLEIYGDENVDDLIKSIKEIGIQHALIVTTSGLIISGNRRYKAARTIGLVEVPVDIRVYKNELDEWEALLECNKQREKTKEQMGAEGDLYEEIEKRRGEEIRNSRLTHSLVVQPVAQRGKTRDIIAQKVGLGTGWHYEQVQYVRTAIKDLPEEQAKVLKVLLEKSTKTAYRIVKEGLVDRLTPDIIVKLQNEDVPATRIYRKIKLEEYGEEEQIEVDNNDPNRDPRTAHPEAVYYCNDCEQYFKISGRTTCPACDSSNIAFSDWHAECAYHPPKPLKEVLTFCPCGCGYGIDPDEEKWYSPEEMEGKYV